ncbi:MAG: Na(+)/H(+) antiporter subunit D, partial [Rhodospirillaceae bacterium]|nr:Na(+)/H(+) antiporter subunit D [Rhodospirillaceae bacterium]
TVFAVMAFGGALYGLTTAGTVELAAAFVYTGAAVGVSLAGDLLSLAVFWEVMAAASTVVIWAGGTAAARAAGLRYLMVHLMGGALLMAGVAMHAGATGSIAVGRIALDGPGAWLILAGVLVNAGAPPLSAWLPDAYPEASPTGTVFLSAFTTKAAVYALLRAFAGEDLLVWIGLYMAFYGIIYALLENDARRILSYSIINQVGFMVAGAGIGTAMAVNGAAAHAFAHIIYKALLMMSAGAVLHATGRRKCTELGGLWRAMPVTAALGCVGALSISAFPLTSGFVSKSMIGEAAAQDHLGAVWFLLTAASAGVFLHAGIKFPWFVFFNRDAGLRPPEAPRPMRLAMALFAVLCVGLGLWPQPLYALLPYPVTFVPYTAAHVVSQLQLLLFSGLAFFVLLPALRRTATLSLDWDWFYRRFARLAWRELGLRGLRLGGALRLGAMRRLDRFIAEVARHNGPQGVLARTWPSGSTVLWVGALLALYLVLYTL